MKAIRAEINRLREIVIASGVNPDRADTSARNKAMVNMRQEGATYAQIGAKHGLSASRVSDILHKKMGPRTS